MEQNRERPAAPPVIRPEHVEEGIIDFKKIGSLCGLSFVSGIFFGLGWLGTFYLLRNKIAPK
jgi:hypothetical protein